MLRIYSNLTGDPISAGDMSNPILSVYNTANLQPIAQPLYLHNSDPLVYYSGITIWVPAELVPNNWLAKLISQTTKPTTAQWSAVESGNTLAMADVVDQQYYPFWLYLEVPTDISVQTITNIKLRIKYKEYLQ